MSDRIRVLALDHYFDQDLRALAANPRLEVRRFPYQRLRGPALRIMGGAVATGLDAFARTALEPARREYAAWLASEVRRLYLERAFDVIVLPSDTFFYVRYLPQAAHSLGLPVVVVQKETTISVDTMQSHSAHVRELAPMIADFMTVCSARHKEFWLRTGADADRIEVTGQPRFDVYASPAPRVARRRRQVLFLTYELDAYVPGAGGGLGLHTWEPLRDATEQVLLDAARSGLCDVTVKCHPQQNHRAEAARLSRRAGATWNRGMSLADVDADTRELVLAADVVVGFQTTALYEAVASRRPVVYAAWGEAYDRFLTQLIPFDQAPPECLHHADSPGALASMLVGAAAPLVSPCRAWYEDALGPIDGRATERVVAILERVVAAWPVTEERRDLELRRRRFATGLLVRSLAAEALWTAGLPVAHIAGRHRAAELRRTRARADRVMAVSTLRNGPVSRC